MPPIPPTGRIDVHSHMLPGIDDGCEDLNESIASIKLLTQAGYVGTICTPHLWPDLFPDNTPVNIQRWTTQLTKQLEERGIEYTLWPGGELRLFKGAIDWMKTHGVPTLADSKYVLADFWEDNWPRHVDKAFDWLLAEGYDPQKIALSGDYAGGGLVVALLVALRYLGEPMPAAGVCMSAWVDLEGTGESMTTKAEEDPIVQKEMLEFMAQLYLGDRDRKTPLASPLYADLRGLPPLLIQVGSAETLLDDSTRLAERAKAAGVEVDLQVWDDMIHVWHMFAAVLPEGQQAIEQIGEFIREKTDTKSKRGRWAL